MQVVKFKLDDGGRRAAGFRPANVGDCVCRAVAIVTRQPYRDVHSDLSELCRASRERRTSDPCSAERGISVQRHWFIRYMAEHGFFYTYLRRPWPVLGYSDARIPRGRICVETFDHFAAIIGNVLCDTADRRGFHSQRVYGYWRQRKVSAKQLRCFLDNLRNSVILKG